MTHLKKLLKANIAYYEELQYYFKPKSFDTSTSLSPCIRNFIIGNRGTIVMSLKVMIDENICVLCNRVWLAHVR